MATITSIKLYDADRALQSDPGGVDIYTAVEGPIVRSAKLGEAEKVSFSLFAGSAAATTVDGNGDQVIRRRRILRFVYSDGSFREYRVTKFKRTLSGDTAAIVQGEYLPHRELNDNVPTRTLTSGVADVGVSLSGTPQSVLDALLATTYGVPGTMKPGTVTSSVTEVAIRSDGTLSFGDLVRSIAEQCECEIEFEYDSGDTKYFVHIREEIGWTAAERTAGNADPSRRPVGIGDTTNGNRVELTRESNERGYLSRIIPLGGPEDETRTIADATFACSAAVFSSPSTTLTLSGSPVFATDALIGLYAGNDSDGWFVITDSTATDTVVVTGDASALNGNSVGFAINGSGHELVYLDHPSAEDGTVAKGVRFSNVLPFTNLLEEAGASVDMSTFSAGVPVGSALVGSPTVTEETSDLYVQHGTKSAKVVASEDEGLSWAITLAPTAERPKHAVYLHLRVTSGKAIMRFTDADGIVHPEDAEASSTQDQLVGIYMDGQTFAAGAGSLEVIAYGGAATFYIDAITFTNSEGAYPYSALMGPEELWREGGRYLNRLDVYNDIYDGELFDVSFLGVASTDPVELGSWIRLKDGWNGSTHDISVDARVVEIRMTEDPVTGAFRRQVAISRKNPEFADRFGDFNGPRMYVNPGGGPAFSVMPRLLAQDVYIDQEGRLHVVWNGDYRTNGVYVTVTSGASPSDPADPTAAANDFTDANEDGDINMGALVATDTAIVKIRPYQTSGPVGEVRRLSIKGVQRAVNWKGAWDNGETDYRVNDAVTHNGTGYICILAHDATAISTDEPGLGAAWETYWAVYSQGFTDTGAWATATPYAVGNIVQNDGATYHCTAAHTSGASTEPGVGGSWASYWTLWAAKGDTGVSQQNRGSWATSTAYVNDATNIDYVEHNGAYYACISSHTSGASTEPGVGASWATVWDLAVAKGDTGPTGATGVSQRNRGAWVTSTAYVNNSTYIDYVQNGGNYYACDVSHTSGASTEPGVGASWATYWSLVVEKGDTGAAGSDGADGLSVNWIAGGWPTGSPYAVNDAVSNDGKSYICIVAHSAAGSNEPGVGASWATYWEIMADKGDTGATGATGPEGPAGMDYQGLWVTSTSYALDDAVRGDDGRVYICILAHTSGASTKPPTGASYATYWTLFVDRGPGRLAAFDVTFTPKVGNEHNVLTYTTGTIEYDDGTSYTINWSTRELTFTSASTYYYVYFDPAINNDRFQVTSTRATAVAAGTTNERVFIGVGRQGSASGEYLHFFPSWGKPVVSEQVMNVTSLSALFAVIDLLEIADALVVATGGEITNASSDYTLDENGLKFEQDTGAGVNPPRGLEWFSGATMTGYMTNFAAGSDDVSAVWGLTMAQIRAGNNDANGDQIVLALIRENAASPDQYAVFQNVNWFDLNCYLTDLYWSQYLGQASAPAGRAGDFTQYADDKELPKGRVGTSGPVGIPITWFSLYTATSVADTTTETTLLGTGKGTLTIPANHLVQGSTFSFKASGIVSADGGNTVTLRIKLGSTTLDSVALSTGSYTNRHWSVEAQIVVASVSGSTANVRLQGVFRHRQAPSSNLTVMPFETTATVGITATSSQAFSLTAQWSSADPVDTIEATNAVLVQEY